jgi:hypothetical protein
VRIFLDFDGVLRRRSSPPSALDADCVEKFAQSVLWHPDVQVVISSAWRLVYSLRALRALFPSELGARVEGVTPEVARPQLRHRHDEILAYLHHRQLQATRWIAVDDRPQQFRPDASLLVVDPACGFDEACASRLRAWLAGGTES